MIQEPKDTRGPPCVAGSAGAFVTPLTVYACLPRRLYVLPRLFFYLFYLLFNGPRWSPIISECAGPIFAKLSGIGRYVNAYI